ncbi:MAG: hypothetical protein AB7E47_02335 [Desulfovibrionaceae bacterium]
MTTFLKLLMAITAAWQAGSPTLFEMAERLSAEGYDVPGGDDLRVAAAALRELPDLPTA